MTTTLYDEPRRPHLAGWLPFIRHYIEMVLAMAVGMFASMPLGRAAFQAAGVPHLMDHAVRHASRFRSGGNRTGLNPCARDRRVLPRRSTQ